MTDRVDERVRIISIGRLAAGIAFIISGVIAAPIIANLGWSTTTMIMMDIAFAVMIPVRFLVKERMVYKRTDRVTFTSIVPILILPIFVPALVRTMGKKRLFMILAGLSVVAGLIQYFASDTGAFRPFSC